MAFDFTGFAAIPGIDDIRENIEAEITWGPWEYARSFIVPTFLDGAARDLGADPTTLMRPGLLLGQNRTTKKTSAWNPAGTDGTQDLFGVLLWDAITQQFGVDKDRWFGFALVGGNIKAKSLIIPGPGSTAGLAGKPLEHYVRGLLTPRYLTDDMYHQYSGSSLMGGWKAIHTVSANTVVSPQDNGTLFVVEGGNVDFTLPAIANSQGQRYGFYVASDHNMLVQSAAAGGLIVYNNVAADSVAFSTAGEKIGGYIEVIGFDNSKWLTMMHLANEAQTITIV